MSTSALAGKVGLVVGVANKRSISWAIAQAAADAGASLALTYQGERLEENVRELAATLTDPLMLPCDVTSDERDRRGRSPAIDGALRRARFPGARRRRSRTREDLTRPFVETVARRIPDGARRQRVLARRAVPAGGAAHGKARRRQHPDADLSRQRARVSELQRDGRGESRARVVGALPGVGSRPEEHPRERDLRRRRSRRWPRPASPGFPRFCRPTAIARRSAARSKPARSPTPRCSCSAPAGRGVTGEVLMVDGGFHAMGI